MIVTEGTLRGEEGEFVTDRGRGVDQGDGEDVVVTVEDCCMDVQYYW